MGGRGGARNSIVKFLSLMIDAVSGSQKSHTAGHCRDSAATSNVASQKAVISHIEI
jgi:hypothetical protein